MSTPAARNPASAVAAAVFPYPHPSSTRVAASGPSIRRIEDTGRYPAALSPIPLVPQLPVTGWNSRIQSTDVAISWIAPSGLPRRYFCRYEWTVPGAAWTRPLIRWNTS
jgi:hypothetical protein